MRCQNCDYENRPKDKFCGNCGMDLVGNADSISDYEKEIRNFANKQENVNKLESIDDLDLNNPTGLLKAQLKMLISIYRRVEKLENNDKQRVRITDFDMPFWSMVGFELKFMLVGLFIISILSCIMYILLAPFLKSILLPLAF